MSAGIDIEQRGAIRVVTVRNPARRNALDPTLLGQLHAAFVAPLNGVRALVIRGDGAKAFCAGYDLSALAAPDSERLPDDPIGEAYAALEALPVPTIALIHGAAFGAGCELACACDFRFAAHDAVFCIPPAKLGVVYAPEGIRRVVQLVGASRARKMFFTGCRVASDEALRWGLVDELHDSATLDAAVFKVAEELAANAPLAVAGMKRIFRALDSRDSLDVGEIRELRRAAFQSADAAEGRAAFLEKRAPVFSGR